MRLNKKILSATVLIVVLSLALNLVSFAAQPYSQYTGIGESYRYSDWKLSAEKDGSEQVPGIGSVDTFSGYPSSIAGSPREGFTDGILMWVHFPNSSSTFFNDGYSFVVDFRLTIANCHEASIESILFGDIAYGGARISGQFNGSIWYGTSDGVDYCYIDGQMVWNFPQNGYNPLVLLAFNTDYYTYVLGSLRGCYLISPEQQIIDGWNGSGLDDSGAQLGGALGDLDDMQQNADNDLHDALGDLDSPSVDFDGNAVSFITSSVSMLWGSLGGFSAVLLCALFITVFNFISRYRGS